MIIGPLHVTITKTANGQQEYIQILSADMTVNVVLVAEQIELRDARPVKKPKRGEK